METTAMDKERLKELVRRVAQIELRARRASQNEIAGPYRSVFRGRGMDFDDVREYAPGDEVRTIDWNVTARAGRPFVKQFREERDVTLQLVVDVSASSDYGSLHGCKRELTAELAAVLALSGVRNNDRVGLVLYSDRIEGYVPPRRGRLHALRVLHEILACKPEGRGTDLAHAIDFVRERTRRRSMIFVLSDLQAVADEPRAVEALRLALRPAARRHDVVALHVIDPLELELPDVGLLSLEDAESGEVVELDTGSGAVRDAFATDARRRQEELVRMLAKEGVDRVAIDMSRPYLGALVSFFRRRRGGRA
jgi:uncharacterized protein (DUF58 family)